MKYKDIRAVEDARELISPPGDTLLETIDELGISQTELANRTGRPIKTINEIIQGKAAIMPETAIQLERVLGISAKFWMNREHSYRLELAEIQEAEKLFAAKEWLDNFPLLDMRKLGWIDFENGNTLQKFNSILSFFGVSNSEVFDKHYNLSSYAIACRKAKTTKTNPYAVIAWLRQGDLQASQMEVVNYDVKKFKENLKEIKSIMAEHPADFFPKLQALCFEAGVKVVHTPSLPNTQIHGSTRWINGTPLIQLSNQYRRNDIFWFTFFHEAGHLIKHGKKDMFIEGMTFKENIEKEKEADDFAINYTFSEKEELAFLDELDNQEDQVDFVYNYAKKINTHPALIIGRLAKEDILHDSIGWTRKFYQKVLLS
jgi:HTH-type transcriptional regulator/antitoxin HigA